MLNGVAEARVLLRRLWFVGECCNEVAVMVLCSSCHAEAAVLNVVSLLE